jgi:hypothetical protein
LFITGIKAYKYVLQAALKLISTIRTILTSFGFTKGTGNAELDKIIEAAGYRYDSEQDIFYSHMYPWQRNYGYCRLYDEAAAPLGMIVDCEPFYFKYGGKKWLIEIWKGQYDMTTGCEIGIYTTTGPDLNIPGVFNGTFYNCASDKDRLKMSCILKKDGINLLTRDEKHWWLTGFKLGEFSEPSQLSMEISITLKDDTMCYAFVKELVKAGYSIDEIKKDGNTVNFTFDKPHLPQPNTRTPDTDRIIQEKNKILCDMYQSVTSVSDIFPVKIKALKEQKPELYQKVINMGRPKQLYKVYELIKNYLS